VSQTKQPSQPPGNPDVVGWGVGCLVASAATLGVVILVFIVAVALQPPVWVQITVGIALAIGATVLAWLVASAVGQAKKGRTADAGAPQLRPVDDSDNLAV
jgi:membrane protein implicated in regulation of membrane protease activity